ncbi:MAG: aminopeptidase P family protein [Planctomycetes bacterium]|nr:aminopeptidase P family protein [Planctomycetota bacterium]
MLDREACRRRIQRLCDLVGPGSQPDRPQAILLCRPEHLLYFANVSPLPTTLNYRAPCFLLIHATGSSTLFTDNWIGPPPDNAADEVVVTEWYNMKKPASLRAQAVAEVVAEHLERLGLRSIAGEAGAMPAPMAAKLQAFVDVNPDLLKLREIKDEDEVRAIQAAVQVAEIAQEACRQFVRPGLREIEVYAHLLERVTSGIGQPFQMLCDLASGERSTAGGGSPTDRILKKGELIILDFFPILQGYRGDIANTLAVDGCPTPAQEEAFGLVLEALQAGEQRLGAGVPVSDVFYAMDGVFRRHASKGWSLIHHGGHGLGLEHPEPPHIVPESDRKLAEGMVITLEPGLYHDSFGGVRLENDYLIAKSGFVKLSNHHLGLK